MMAVPIPATIANVNAAHIAPALKKHALRAAHAAFRLITARPRRGASVSARTNGARREGLSCDGSRLGSWKAPAFGRLRGAATRPDCLRLPTVI